MADDEILDLIHPEPKIRDYESFSSLTTYLDCQMIYYFRYIQKIRVPPAVAMARGTAGHKAQEHNFKQKIESHQDLPVDEVLDVAADEFDRASALIENWEDESPGRVKDNIIDLCKTYHLEHAPTIQPLEVEKEFILNIGATKMKLYRDLKDTKNTIRDSKFTAKKKSENDVNMDLQGTIYTFVDQTPNFCIDAVIGKTKKSPNRIETTMSTRSIEDWNQLKNYYIPRIVAGIKASIKTGDFIPCNPTSWKHSEKFCGYWNICQFGGKFRSKKIVDVKPKGFEELL